LVFGGVEASEAPLIPPKSAADLGGDRRIVILNIVKDPSGFLGEIPSAAAASG